MKQYAKWEPNISGQQSICMRQVDDGTFECINCHLLYLEDIYKDGKLYTTMWADYYCKTGEEMLRHLEAHSKYGHNIGEAYDNLYFDVTGERLPKWEDFYPEEKGRWDFPNCPKCAGENK